jgi:hypothetical protein
MAERFTAIKDRIGKKKADYYIWWLAMSNDKLTFNMLSQAKKDGGFH